MEWFQVKLQWTFEDICGGKFWDHNLTWNSEYPDFTPCFHDSILVWLPCVFLWIWLPWYFYFYGNFERKPFTWNKLCGSKMVLAILLMFTSGCEAITAWSQFTSAHHVAGSAIYFLSSAIRTMTMLVVIAMIQQDRRKSVYSNGGLWTFWFIDTITTMVTAYSYILRAYVRPDGSLRGEFHVTDVFRFSASLGHFVMVSVSLLLSCFPDMPDDYVPNEKTFPQLHASFPSHLIYHWHSKFLKKGSMKPLETEDLWLLRPCDQVNNYTPGFQKVWREKVEQYHRDRKVSEETESANKSLSSSQCDGQGNGSLKHRKVAKDISTSQDKPKSNDNSHDEDTENQSKDDNKRPSFLLLALIQYLGIEHLFGWILFSIGEALELCFPVVLGLLIDFFGSEDEHFWKGYLYSFLFLLLVVGSVTFQQQFFWIFSYMSTRMRGLLISTLYRKALTLSSRARKQHSAGELVNLMSEDVGRLRYMYLLAVITVNIPFTVALALYMLWQLVGVSVLAGLVLILINIPLNGLMESKYNKRMHKKMCDLRDQRMKIVNDVLNGIKVLKLYAWEKSFEKKINDVRDEEMTMMMKQTCLQACHSFIVLLIPFLVLLSIFATYIMIDERNSLDAKTAFMAVSYIEMLRGGLVAAPGRLNYFTECWVSLKRIEKYLCLEEIDPDNVIKNPDALHPLTVSNGEFSWDRKQKPTLKNINFTAQEGSLVAVVGQVGAGKSSLLSAMLGEMEKISGTVTVKSSVAYSSQQAWIQNATIENNILFGSQREEKRYQKIIEACALKPDLDILIDGDQCEIGEKGINLSGGQKQRVGLARAIYSSADIYLLDDPLSAVDAHVGKQIFDKVIGKKGLLKKKTRILVTQGVQWLPYVDRIYVMEDGRISETGTYQELLSHDGAFAQYLKTHAKEEVVIESEEEDVLSYSHTSLSLSWGRSAAAGFDHKKRAMRKMEKDGNRYVRQLSGDPHVMEELDLSSDDTDYEELFSEITPRIARKSSASDKKPKKLIEDESTEVGSFRWSIMATYLKAMGIRVSIAILLMVILAQSFEPLSELWLSKWTGDPLITNSSLRNSSDYKNLQNYYITTYAALGLCQSTASVIFHLSFVFMSIGAARKMHDGMLRRILQAPMSFFDSTPTGRILNRFSNDIPAVDNMKNDMKEFMRCILFCCSTLFMLVYTTPTLTLTIIPIGYVYYSLKESFVPTQQQLRKLDSNTNSPIYSHFSETLNGTSTIRAFSRQDQFIADSDVILDRNQTVNFAFECGWRWISTRVENLCGVVTCVAALLSLHNGRSSVALGALAIMSGWKTGRCFHWLMFNMWHFNLRLVSVERVKEYSEINTEADWSVESTKPLVDWPTAGAIDIENFSVRYREGLNLVLKDMNCHINPKEKVGIVGRTGAGKSSLTMSLFRILEAAGGTIKIDGVDISSLGLHDLRSKLTILPQDPVLFAGTLRSNLDPFECYTTEQIWTALEHCHLKTFVEQLPDRLLYECGEGGENLSVGQRQLICLGRSLLKKTKVLVLDEATAAVDLETDDLIQKTIRSEFAECTVLTIAHRLKTIIDYDKVMVLDKGEIKEFDSPENLLNAPDSIFYGLAKDAGLVS